jgi:hypothetical protein
MIMTNDAVSQMAEAVAVLPALPAQDIAAKAAEDRLAELLSLGSQANAATCVYGDTGTGKTRLLCTAIEYNWETYHRLSRVLTVDLGGFGNKLLSLIRLGIAQVYNPTTHIEPFETFELVSLGYWPETISDPYTGYADPHVRLIAPRVKRWSIYCPSGHLVRTLTDGRNLYGFQVACPTCQQITSPANWSKCDQQTVISPGFKHVGLWAFDSMTALEEGVMADMANRKDLGGEKGAINTIVSGSMSFGSNNRAHYGFAQNRAYQWIKNARTIPGQTMPPIFTFLELRAADEGKGIPLFGPKIAGNAKTADVPSWFGNCLNSTKEKDEKGRDVYRLYTETHMNLLEGNIPHVAKTRADPGAFVPPYLQDQDGEQPFTTFSLAYFFRTLDVALERNTRQDAAKYQDAPAFQPFADDDKEEVVEETTLGTGPAMISAAGAVVPQGAAGAVVSRARGRAAGRPALPPPVQAPTISLPSPSSAPGPSPAGPAVVAQPVPTGGPAAPVAGPAAMLPTGVQGPQTPPALLTPPTGPVAAPVRPSRARARPAVPPPAGAKTS